MNRPVFPQKLPCGCNSAVHGPLTRDAVLVLYDGTRVCKRHGKRYRLVFEEVKI